MVFSIRLVNRRCVSSVPRAGVSIICFICSSNASIIARRNTKWLCFFSFEVIEIKKFPPYPACSHCFNEVQRVRTPKA
ncbi:hypothetical protein NEDG_00395 [Nematocida displodere]|uniref:Uncharacterized protein n=1 Tax=Nematocida displodere TaxID=1805483 RepID=A0A177EKM9_9MICR|nr:hypothetical protein NEDG_00395 [Nematocida displodere]